MIMMFSTVSLIGGFVSYCYLLFPMGKVIRDIKDANMSPFRRVFRRALPFIGLSIPFIIARDLIEDANHKYMDEWFIKQY